MYAPREVRSRRRAFSGQVIRDQEFRGERLERQPVILGFRVLQYRDSRIRVFPKCEESLIGSFRLGLVSRQSEYSSELQVCQCADRVQPHDATMIEKFLKFSCGFRVPSRGNESLASHIGRVQTAKIIMSEVEAIHGQLITPCDFKALQGICGLSSPQ